MTRGVAVALGALAAAQAARADSLNWIGAKLPNTGNDPFPYWLDNRARNASLPTAAQSETAARAAYQKWEDVACAFITFAYRGQVASGPSADDQKNVMVAFVQDRTQDLRAYDYALGGGAAMAATLTLMYNGVIYDCDTVFNAVDWQWSAGGTSVAGKLDLDTLALHEFGHCLGLGHYTGDRNAVMYPTVGAGELRLQLGPHDVDNVCQLYPQTGSIGSSCETVACVATLSCVPDPTTQKKFCTRSCDPSAPDCPTGTWCKPFSDPSPGACFPGNPPTVAGIGAPCTDDASCAANGMCFNVAPWTGGYCSQQCSGAGGSPCPPQATCYDDACDPPGTCYCLKDCRPGYGDCRQGYTCEPLTGGRGRCRPSCASDADCQARGCSGCTCRTCDGLCLREGSASAKVGDACSRHEQCPQGMFCMIEQNAPGFVGGYCTASCYTRCTSCPAESACLPWDTGGELLCQRTCTSTADCRSGYACTAVGSSRACQPGCKLDTDCPVGDKCVGGRCSFASDGGASPGPVKPGCGCAAASSPAAAAALIIGIAAPVRRRLRRR